MRHCDDYIDDESQPLVLRRFLEQARSPAHGRTSTEPYPALFATHLGMRVRVVMASRLGDVGITTILANDIDYERRVGIDELSDFTDTPHLTAAELEVLELHAWSAAPPLVRLAILRACEEIRTRRQIP